MSLPPDGELPFRSGAPVGSLTRAIATRRLIVGLEGGVARRRIVDVDVDVEVKGRPEPTLPGWQDIVVLGDVDVIDEPYDDGAWVSRNMAFKRTPDIALVPVTLAAAIRAVVANARKNPPELIGIIMLALFLGFFWWFFAILIGARVVHLLLFRRRLGFRADGVWGECDDGRVQVAPPYKLRAKIRATRGSQSKKRKVTAALVIVDHAGREQRVRFETAEHLLRFAQTLRRELNIKVREDIKLDGVAALDGDPA